MRRAINGLILRPRPNVREASSIRRVGGWLTVIEVFKRIVIVAGALIAAGCASLPDFNRIQGTMDRMAYYTGVMACNMPLMTSSMSRMVEVIERMERRTDSIVADLQKQGKTMEATVQNFGQSFLDSDKAMIRNVKGIQEELAELRKTLRTPLPHAGPGASKDQDELNAKIQAKLSDLDAKLTALGSQVARQSASRSATR